MNIQEIIARYCENKTKLYIKLFSEKETYDVFISDYGINFIAVKSNIQPQLRPMLINIENIEHMREV